jgi:hypothetical protein
MASVTAEVLMHFGAGGDDWYLVQSIDTLRFDFEIENSAAIIKILEPAFWCGHGAGMKDAEDLHSAGLDGN